jgi:uncharacterized membrane protein
MDMKRIAIGTIVGAVTYFVAGYLIFEVGTADFYAENLGSATGLYRDAPLQWAIALGCLSLAALITLGVETRGTPTIAAGVIAGAIIGFLVWLGVDFTRYGNANAWNLTLTIVDPLLELIRGGITGAVIAAVLVRVPKSTVNRSVA